MKKDMSTRGLIIHAGLRLARNGLHNVTMAGVARESGFSRRTVYNYFDTLEELCQAVRDRAYAVEDKAVIKWLLLEQELTR